MKLKPQLPDAPEAVIQTITKLTGVAEIPDDLISVCRKQFYPLMTVDRNGTHLPIFPGGELPGSVYVELA